MRTSRRDGDAPVVPALASAVVLLVVLAAMIAVLTPWHPLSGAVPGGHVRPDAAADFTPAQLARLSSYHSTIRPFGLLGLGLGIVVPAVLGFTRVGARVVGRLPRRWPVRTLLAVVVVTGLALLVQLPVAAHELVIERRYGLTHQSWAGWWSDVARGYLVTVVSTGVAALLVVALARRSPRRWWLHGAAIGAALVVAGSFVYPFTVEPLFTSTSSLPAGPLRTSLLALARQDGQPLHDILVAHEAARTNAENAYVSGFGSSRRLVLYDTLLHDDSPAEIRVITAHELGHSRRDDVLHGTIEGAVAVAAALCLAGAVLGAGSRLTRRTGSDGAGDPRVVPLLLASYTVVAFAVSPLVNLVSRHIEARADDHSLTLARDPASFVAAQRQLALSGLDDVTPDGILYVLFFDHPTTPQRIAMARDWARQHHVAVPAPVPTAGSAVPSTP